MFEPKNVFFYICGYKNNRCFKWVWQCGQAAIVKAL